MRLFPSERELARYHWRYFGRPYVTAFGIALLIGLICGVIWVIAGILHFHPLW
jgi:ABC-type multidrug transport system permease subunit